MTFYTCVAFLNSAIDELEYKEQLVNNSRLAAALIPLQLSADPTLGEMPSTKVEADLNKALGMLDTIEKEIAPTK